MNKIYSNFLVNPKIAGKSVVVHQIDVKIQHCYKAVVLISHNGVIHPVIFNEQLSWMLQQYCNIFDS